MNNIHEFIIVQIGNHKETFFSSEFKKASCQGWSRRWKTKTKFHIFNHSFKFFLFHGETNAVFSFPKVLKSNEKATIQFNIFQSFFYFFAVNNMLNILKWTRNEDAHEKKEKLKKKIIKPFLRYWKLNATE